MYTGNNILQKYPVLQYKIQFWLRLKVFFYDLDTHSNGLR